MSCSFPKIRTIKPRAALRTFHVPDLDIKIKWPPIGKPCPTFSLCISTYDFLGVSLRHYQMLSAHHPGLAEWPLMDGHAVIVSTERVKVKVK